MINLEVQGIEINIKEAGEGAPIVLLHGFGGQPSDWRAIASQLSKTHHVLLPNLNRVYLSSETFSQQVEILEFLIEDLYERFGELMVAGASYGGALCWALRQRCPGKISATAMINPMPPRPLKYMESRPLKLLIRLSKYPLFLPIYLRSPLGKKTVTELANSVRVDWVEKFSKFNLMLSRKQKWVSYLLTRFSWVMTREDWQRWEALFDGTGSRSLLVVSENDKVFGRSHAEDFSQALGYCKLIWLKDGAHMAIRTDADRVFEALGQFFTESQKKAS